LTAHVPADNEHVKESKLPLPVDEKVIAPVGLTGSPPLISVTRAVHEDGAPTATAEGMHVTPTKVERCPVNAEELELVRSVETDLVCWVVEDVELGGGEGERNKA
jgi:hypothetical protein